MIRPYQAQDLGALVKVWEVASAGAYPACDQAFFDAERLRICNDYLPRYETWVWATDQGISGFISHHRDFVGGLFVTPEQQGNGIGRALVEHVRRIYGALQVEVFAVNMKARAFYARLEFGLVSEYVHQATAAQILKLGQRQ